jgi:purine-binding chemotaxis protein CheW
MQERGPQMNPKINIQHANELMPKDKSSLKILKERSIAFAKKSTTKLDENYLKRYVRFRLGKNEFYGISYESILEVANNSIAITAIPRMKDYIVGVINRRGNLITIIDLNQFFLSGKSSLSKHYNIIFITARGMSVGVIADHIVGSESYNKDEKQIITPYDGVIDPRYIMGLHKGITSILNVEAILLDIQQKLKQCETKEKLS